jgi:Cu+-exporting ATPase
LDVSQFRKIVSYLHLSKTGVRIIKWSFLLSLVYNVIGLSFAVSGNLMPVVAAILMPLSSISVVIFTTIATQYASRSL